MCLTFYPLLKEVNIYEYNCMLHCCCFSVSQFFLTLCNSMGCSMPGFPVLHHLLELPTLMCIELVMPCNQLILCHPLLLLPSVFHSIRVFSNELVLCIRWPKCWHFSFVFQMGSVVTDTPNYLTWSWVQVSVSTVKCTWEVWCSVLVWGFWRKTLTLVYHLEA